MNDNLFRTIHEDKQNEIPGQNPVHRTGELTGMYQALRPLIFQLEPETAHNLTLGLLRLVAAMPGLRHIVRRLYRTQPKPVHAFGMSFSNPVGLAAGYDKDGLAWRGLALLGFGHIELGTVTLRPQPGNPRPRVFRLVEDEGLINRMGFPGRGSAHLARKLKSPRPPGLILGVNLGINKETSIESAADDYLALIKIFAPLADYLAVNISSPNTPGLRQLQDRYILNDLLARLKSATAEISVAVGRRVPVLIKLAPDLSDRQLDEALEAILENGMDGVIATNTTLRRGGLLSSCSTEEGGLSGAPLLRQSTEIVEKISRRTGRQLPIIAVGGIMSAADALEKLEAGASLVQVYTGLIYRGPGLVKSIIEALP